MAKTKPPAETPRKKGGPAKKIDAAMEAKIIEKVKACGVKRLAASFVDLDYTTVYRHGVQNPAFATALDRAVDHCKLSLVAKVAVAGTKDWKAAAWYLERKWTAEFGRRNADSVTPGQLASTIQQIMAIIAEDVPKKCLAKINEKITLHLETLVNGKASEDVGG